MTVGAVPVPIGIAPAFGVIAADASGRVRAFAEKPARPTPMPSDEHRALASMGNYLFRPDVLLRLLDDAHRRTGTDLGHHVLPHLPATVRTYAYDLRENEVPGLLTCEERGYWRDVGTLPALEEARHDFLGPTPCFNLFNAAWPIRGGTPRPPLRRKPAGTGPVGQSIWPDPRAAMATSALSVPIP